MSIDHELIIPKKKELPKNIKDDPLGTPNLSMIVGSTGSGKSVVLANLLIALQKRHDFDDGLFVTSNNKDPILETIEMPVTTSPAEMENYMNLVRQAKSGTNHILVGDDLQGSPDFKIMTNRSSFVNFMLSHRHFGEDNTKPDVNGTWAVFTAQTLKNSFTPQFRQQVKNWFLFYPRSPPELKNYEDLAQDPAVMRKALGILKTKGKHQFLYINKHNPEKDRYFIGFNEELHDLE